MKHVQMGTDGTYKTSDFYIAAWLLSNGLQIEAVDRRNPRRCNFTFRDREDSPGFVQTRLQREDKTLEDIWGKIASKRGLREDVCKPSLL